MKLKLFSASWCTYCTPVKKYIEENNLDVEIINVDDNKEMTKAAGIRGIPALQLSDGSIMTESKAIISYLSEGDNNE